MSHLHVAGESLAGNDHSLISSTVGRPTFPYRDARLRELQRRRAIDAGQRLLEDVASDLPGVAPETRVTLGTPIEALSALCREESAELLVVGSRGRSPVAAAVLGSVSARLASIAQCPVVVVSAATAAEGFLEPDTRGGASDADGDRKRVGRFSDGIEQYPDSPSKLRTGRFSEGVEQLPDTPMKRRRGSFADSCETTPARSSQELL